MSRPINRITPALPATEMKTYAVHTPLNTHWRKATCAEVNCPHYTLGWKTIIDESTDQGKMQAYYVRNNSGRKYTEQREANMTTFVFEAGQTCFGADKHRTLLDKQEIFVVHDGDHRGNPRGTGVRVHKRPEDWVDDFANHQASIKEILERG